MKDAGMNLTSCDAPFRTSKISGNSRSMKMSIASSGLLADVFWPKSKTFSSSLSSLFLLAACKEKEFFKHSKNVLIIIYTICIAASIVSR